MLLTATPTLLLALQVFKLEYETTRTDVGNVDGEVDDDVDGVTVLVVDDNVLIELVVFAVFTEFVIVVVNTL